VRTLLQQKPIDVNAAAVDGTTALYWAAERDDARMAEMLIRAGANVRAVNRYGVQPLALAAVNGGADVLKLLLDAGADPNAGLAPGETAMMEAARTGKVEALKVLFALNSDTLPMKLSMLSSKIRRRSKIWKQRYRSPPTTPAQISRHGGRLSPVLEI